MPLNSRAWELTRFHPDFILVMFLILMHDHFLAQFGGKDFNRTISVSPIVPCLMAIMSDTRKFPFFSKGNLLKMLACHGTTLHLIRTICGPTTNHKMQSKVMRLILGRVLSGIASTPMAVSCFKRCSRLLKSPLSVPESPICVKMYDAELIFGKLKNIWQMLSLCTILPPADAILDISSENLSPRQMNTYNILYMIIIFRRLFEAQNRVFILLCRYFHLMKKYRKQRRSDYFFIRLRDHTEKKLKLLIATRDFEVYSYYLWYLSTRLLQDCEETPYFVDNSIKILETFFQMMIKIHYNHQRNGKSDFFGLPDLLQEGKPEALLEMLAVYPRLDDKKTTLSFCVSPPVHSSPEWLFPVLQKANLLNWSPFLLDYVESFIFRMEKGVSCDHKMKNQFGRLMVLVLKFAEWSQSVHPHRHFIFEYVSFMKETGRTKYADLARFLDLQKLQSHELRGFYLLFKKFRKFAHQSIGCSEPTERTLLCFFDQMHLVFSNEQFLNRLQELRKTLEIEIISWEAENSRTPYPKCNFYLYARSVIDHFLQDLVGCPQFQTIIEGISYFRRTNCADCREFLDPDNDDGLCDDCQYQRAVDQELENWERR
jgi:hypothetical protein